MLRWGSPREVPSRDSITTPFEMPGYAHIELKQRIENEGCGCSRAVFIAEKAVDRLGRARLAGAPSCSPSMRWEVSEVKRLLRLRVAVFLILLPALLLSACSKKPSGDDDSPKTIVAKATSVQMPNQTCGYLLEQLEKVTEEKVPGKIDIQIFPSAQLYTQQEEIQALQRGEIQFAAVIGTGSLPLVSEAYNAMELPGLFPSHEVFLEVMQGPVGQELFKEFEAKNIKLLGFVGAGALQVSNLKNIEVKLPKDLKGLKIRPAGKTYATLLEQWGALSFNVPSEEQYAALQQRAMDGVMMACQILEQRKLYENLTNTTDLGSDFITRISAMLVNKSFWDSLPSDVQKAIQEAVDQGMQHQEQLQAKLDQEAYDNSAKAGVKVYTPTAEEMEVWLSTAQEAWPELIKSLKIPQEWVDKLSNAVDEAKASK